MGMDKLKPCPCWKVEHGLLVEVPCKIGGIVWVIRNYKGHKYPQKGFVSEMYFLQHDLTHYSSPHSARRIRESHIFDRSRSTKCNKRRKERR